MRAKCDTSSMNPRIKAYKEFYLQGKFLIELRSRKSFSELNIICEKISELEAQLADIHRQIMTLEFTDYEVNKRWLEEEYDIIERKIFSYIVVGIETIKEESRSFFTKN